MTALEYELTDQEAEVAASRAAWRASLSDGLLTRHLGPLAAFVLTILFAATLGLTGLISRRAAEIALIASAAAYMLYRLWTRRRFYAARRAAHALARDWRAAPTRLTCDAEGFCRRSGASEQRWRFADGLEVEEIAGLVYVWARRGAPLVWPRRAGDDAEMLAFARAAARKPPPASADDDD